MTSPADELRAAATKLRETASKATPGPWRIDPEFGDMVTSSEPNWNGNPTVIASDLADGHPGFDWNNVAWIALASPAIAGPLADVLDDQAGAYEVWLDRENHDVAERIVNRALALACAINGGQQS